MCKARICSHMILLLLFVYYIDIKTSSRSAWGVSCLSPSTRRRSSRQIVWVTRASAAPWIGCLQWMSAGSPSALSSCFPGWSTPAIETSSRAWPTCTGPQYARSFVFWLRWSCRAESGFQNWSGWAVPENGDYWTSSGICWGRTYTMKRRRQDAASYSQLFRCVWGSESSYPPGREWRGVWS